MREEVRYALDSVNVVPVKENWNLNGEPLMDRFREVIPGVHSVFVGLESPLVPLTAVLELSSDRHAQSDFSFIQALQFLVDMQSSKFPGGASLRFMPTWPTLAQASAMYSLTFNFEVPLESSRLWLHFFGYGLTLSLPYILVNLDS